MTIDPIVAFLNARLDETEAVATAAGGDHWMNGLPATVHPDPTVFRTVVAPSRAGLRDHVCGSILAADAEHIALHDPRRVLADVEAKRVIVTAYAAVAHYDGPGWTDEGATGRAHGLGEAVRALARAWSGHPDFDPSWAS